MDFMPSEPCAASSQPIAVPGERRYKTRVPALPPFEPYQLISVDPHQPHDEALASYTTPRVILKADSRVVDYNFMDVTHVCLKAYYLEQRLILAGIGVRWDWHYPFIAWHYLGRIASKALFDNENELACFSASVRHERDYVYFSTRRFDAGALPRIKVVEVSLGWKPGEKVDFKQLRAFWKPARLRIFDSINCQLRELALQTSGPSEACGGENEELREEQGVYAMASGMEAPVSAAIERQVVVSGPMVYYSVYYSPTEFRNIPLEQVW